MIIFFQFHEVPLVTTAIALFTLLLCLMSFVNVHLNDHYCLISFYHVSLLSLYLFALPTVTAADFTGQSVFNTNMDAFE